MNWFTWEQHKKQFLILGVILTLYAAVAISAGSLLWHNYQHVLMTCHQADTCKGISQVLFQSGWSHLLNPNASENVLSLLDVIILTMPALLGVFIGVPLIANEYANGTNKLVWTRSVSRRRWLTVKLVWILIVTAVFAAGFALLTTWWSRAGSALFLNRFNSSNFTLQGMVPVGYAVFAVALGTMLGTWFKRMLLAIGVTLAVLLVVQIVIPNWVRPHLMPARHATISLYSRNIGTAVGPDIFTLTVPALPGQSSAWVLSSHAVNATGQAVSAVPAACRPAFGIASQGSDDAGSAQIQDPLDCLARQGLHVAADYQPAYRYWDFQRLETGMYLALSALPIAMTYWLVLKRDA